jgi:hypothetical protein
MQLRALPPADPLQPGTIAFKAAPSSWPAATLLAVAQGELLAESNPFPVTN